MNEGNGGGDRSGPAGSEIGDELSRATEAANDEALLIRIGLLEQQHADLHLAIEALLGQTGSDRLAIARLKKQKLMLKDKIAQLRDQLTPDIIA